MKYDKIKKNAPQLLSLTSLTVAEFESLLLIAYGLHNFRITLKTITN
jgi:DNA-binding CsgD family transcriptional regulator